MQASERRDLLLLLAVAAATVAIHLCTGSRYGFHRDELATLDNARHLAWGYVECPPVTPILGWISLHLFGSSLTGFRFFAALAVAVAVVLTGLMARDLGGGRAAQLLAASAAVPFGLSIGSLMHYVAFDYLAWAAVAYGTVHLIRTGDPRWWLGVGAAVGFGMLSKYTMLFFVAGLATGVLLSDLRSHLRSKWLWLGLGLALAVALPNLFWQWRHDFVSLEFLRDINQRDVRMGRTAGFLPDQIGIALGAFPLALAGLYFYFFSQAGAHYRALGFAFIIPLALFIIAQGRGYYMAPGYLMLYAAGAVLLESTLSQYRRSIRRTAIGLVFAALLASAAMYAALFLPVAPMNSAWWRKENKVNGNLREEIGWPALVATVAGIRDTLPPADRARVAIFASNYGEAGALNLYGADYGLPRAICPMNSSWERGYGDPPPDVLIVLGASRSWVHSTFESCELAGQITNPEHVANEETTEHADIFVCRNPRLPWAILWPQWRSFG